MNVLVIIIGVIAVFVVIRAYVLNIGKNEESTIQRRAEIAARIREKENINAEIQPEKKEKNYESKSYQRLTLEEFNFVNEFGGCIKTEIKGLSYRKPSEKQKAKLLSSGDTLRLKREYNNPVDKHAIAIYSNDNYQLGYIPAYLAEGVSNLLEKKYDLECKVSSKTGHELPYVHILLSYTSDKRIKINEIFNEKWKKLDLKETFRKRLGNSWSEQLNDSYLETISIHGEYVNVELFQVKEVIRTKANGETELEYYYNNNISYENIEMAKEYENCQMYDEAIQLYKTNISLKESLSKSALRLSVLYNKRHQYDESINVLQETISLLNIIREQYDNTEKLKERLERLKTKDHNNDNQVKYKVERLKENIKRTERSIVSLEEKGKDNLAEKARLRLQQYNNELSELEK